MKEELKNIYQSYFPLEHQKCSDECGKKLAELTMQDDFVKEICYTFATKVWEDFEYHGTDFSGNEWNKNLQEIIEWLTE